MKRPAKTDPEIAAYARQAKKEREEADISAFISAYPLATDETLELINGGESPDAICERPDGSEVGVELTTVRRSPDKSFWDEVCRYTDEMDSDDTEEEIIRLIWQKAVLLPKFRTKRTILVIGICESCFEIAVSRISEIPIEDLADTGFGEIWLADYKGIRDGAHREVRLFGLFPPQYREITGRSIFDQKPYG